MVSSAALPGAALRVMRTAAGRRALYVALLVGGVFALGMLCGERAQAADETSPSLSPSLRDTVGKVVDVPGQVLGRASGPTGSAAGARDTRQNPPTGLSGRSELSGLQPVADVAGVADEVVRTVGDGVVRPVGDVVGQVTAGLGTVVERTVPVVPPSVPVLPTLPSSPPSTSPDPADHGDLPGLPALPGLPGLPDLSDGTDGTDATGPTDPADLPVQSAPEASASYTAPPATPHTTTPAKAPKTPDATAATPRTPAAYGPRPTATPVADTATPHAGTHRATPTPAAPTRHAPAHQGPTGDPDGALGTASGADQGVPRHGDAHAVAPQHRIPFLLVPGALERADAAETQDRYRDIPVSPA